MEPKLKIKFVATPTRKCVSPERIQWALRASRICFWVNACVDGPTTAATSDAFPNVRRCMSKQRMLMHIVHRIKCSKRNRTNARTHRWCCARITHPAYVECEVRTKNKTEKAEPTWTWYAYLIRNTFSLPFQFIYIYIYCSHCSHSKHVVVKFTNVSPNWTNEQNFCFHSLLFTSAVTALLRLLALHMHTCTAQSKKTHTNARRKHTQPHAIATTIAIDRMRREEKHGVRWKRTHR